MQPTPVDAPAVRASRNRAMWVAALVLVLVGAAGVATGIALERRVLSRHGDMRRGPRGGEFGRGGRGGRPAVLTPDQVQKFRARAPGGPGDRRGRGGGPPF